MPHIPPINRRELKKSGILDEDRFFQLLSERCNYIDKDTSKVYYMALVKLITSELRTNGIVRLPHIGDFALVKQNPKIVWTGKVRRRIDAAYALKFYVKEALRIYFNKLNELSTEDQKLDPRQKILEQDI